MSGRIKPEGDGLAEQPPIHHEPVRKKQEIRAKPVVHANVSPGISPESGTDTGTENGNYFEAQTGFPPRGDTRPGDTAMLIHYLPKIPPRNHNSPKVISPDDKDDEVVLTIRDTAIRAKDRVFEGRDVQKPKTSTVKDASLLHTSLKPKNALHIRRGDSAPVEDNGETTVPDSQDRKTNKKGKKPDDISWT